ncbi:MAG: hypothetical protein JRJ14_10710 [Deltaproteobacteria bacterium]|nr:hypothetical protein [Deltaproteobacteria bacterium]
MSVVIAAGNAVERIDLIDYAGCPIPFRGGLKSVKIPLLKEWGTMIYMTKLSAADMGIGRARGWGRPSYYVLGKRPHLPRVRSTGLLTYSIQLSLQFILRQSL